MKLEIVYYRDMNLETFTKQFAKELPDTPGVYFFLDGKGGILYIGKATSLQDRVKSYFTQDMLLTRGPKIVRMLLLAERIEWQATDSALEALLLEANLVRRHCPPYNTDLKDDKSWNFVVITEEKFPRVLVERGKNIESQEELGIKNKEAGEVKRGTRNSELGTNIRKTFGPFPSGGSLKEAMKIVRRIFPFRDRCVPFEGKILNVSSSDHLVGAEENASHLKSGWIPASAGMTEEEGMAKDGRKGTKGTKLCFNAQIGLCPGMCAGNISAREYAKTIRNIILFFEGKKTKLVQNLEREMKREAKALRFERANAIKKTLFALGHIQDVALLKRNLFESPSFENSGEPKRIEAYDVAHLGGSETVGVMTVVSGGSAEKNDYRKFIILGSPKLGEGDRGVPNGNDLAALEELLRRRFVHTEWGLPSLIVVDGSHLQRHVAEAVLKDFSLDIPIVSVVKDARHQPKSILGPKKERDAFKNDILFANSEAHRYAISFHRKRRGKAFLHS